MRTFSMRQVMLCRGSAAALLLGCGLAAGPLDAALAQPATSAAGGDGGSSLSEVVVTATKGSATNVQQVPITVQALTGQQLAQVGAVNFSEMYHLVPGLAVADNGPGDKRYIIRGINSAGASTIGVYLDDVVITGENNQDGGGQQEDVQLFDIQRVEVLKGPQGTTFGSSSMAGTIRYITNKPDLTTYGGQVRVAAREVAGSAVGPEVDGALNFPVITDRLAIRVAGFYTNLPGWIDNKFEKNANTEETSAFRVEATAALTDDLTLSGTLMHQVTHQDARSYYNTTDYFGNALPQFYQADITRNPWDESSWIYNGTLQYKRDFGTFTATASRFQRDLTFSRDASDAANAFFGLPIVGSGTSILSQPKTRTVDSYEARFSSSWDAPVQLLTGLYYQNEHRHFRSYWKTVDADGFLDENGADYLDRTVSDRLEEKAAYAELTFRVTDKLQIITGGRYYDINTNETSNNAVAAGGGPGSGPGEPTHYKDNGAIGRFNVSYNFTPDVKGYVQVAQGFRSGGTNDTTAAQIAHVTIPGGYGSDSLINYEAGLKTSFFDHRLFIDGAIYHVDWDDIQLQNQATNGTLSFPYTGNGGKAAVDGGELSIEADPMAGLQLTGSFSYNYARLTEDNPIASTGLKGDLIPYVPRITASAGANYEWPLGIKDLDGMIGGDISYTSKSATYLNSTIQGYHPLPSYVLVNLHAGISKGPYSLMAVVDNLADDHTVISYTTVVDGVYPDAYITNRPRMVSLVLSARF
ncbi:MAG: TonB-dependent receptor [Caulobacteraceae bacterium]